MENGGKMRGLALSTQTLMCAHEGLENYAYLIRCMASHNVATRHLMDQDYAMPAAPQTEGLVVPLAEGYS